eukprot:TRINITY_DN61433_c0_g1_i1.p1 TRINITY_DN61433_c0_g1~~TRINITY_DN61433_c0_g1_i1.p1  ORF type:complete len:628 (-),score=91.09 TRINITY_DN61433_c0_g1_i1:307-2190(-)
MVASIAGLAVSQLSTSAPASEKSEVAGKWLVGEVHHEKELFHRKLDQRGNNFGDALARPIEEKKALQKELGYPEYDPRFDDPAWLRQQIQKENENPDENANLLLDPKHPEFWHNAARRPYAKAILRCEEHWNHRRNVWKQQYARVEEMNYHRKAIADLVTQCRGELKRIVAPVLHYKIMEVFLTSVAMQANEYNMGFEELLDEEETRGLLLYLRQELDTRGVSAATLLLEDFERNAVRCAAEDEAERRRLREDHGVSFIDVKTLTNALNFGTKCKNDGSIEWAKSNYEEALLSWRQGEAALSQLGASEECRRRHPALGTLHAALLKNQALAANRLCYWNEASEAASKALKLNDQDHKTWFRKACACEGLGLLDAAEECLQRVDDIAERTDDWEQIKTETDAKRSQIERNRQREQVAQKRMLDRSLQQSVFSKSRDAVVSIQEPTIARGPPILSDSLKKPPQSEEHSRKRLTRVGAEILLDELQSAYKDTTFRMQVQKLAKDVCENKAEFICYLRKVALPVQLPVLERWGFESSERGVDEMSKAIQDHTRGKDLDFALKRKAEETLQVLYGPMYEVMRGSLAAPSVAQATAARRRGNAAKCQLSPMEARRQKCRHTNSSVDQASSDGD